MSIGEEESEGQRLRQKKRLLLLRQLSNINFVGNVEGRDVFPRSCRRHRHRRLHWKRDVEAF